MRSWCLILGLVWGSVGCHDKSVDDTADADADGDGYTVADGDCDDNDAAINPAATEIADELDNDCDGATDEYLTLVDADGDGYAEATGDCDDADAAVNPDASEVAGDGIDNDCDGETDEVSTDADADGDGYTTDDGDCDDTEASVYPGADETYYDGVDSNCDGLSDNDMDEDGYDSEDQGGDDCNDNNVSAYPGAYEICDGVDQDCDGELDNGAIDATTGYPDNDGDGYGTDVDAQLLCRLPDDFSEVPGDCDDADAEIHPGATEICGDTLDSDCDGSTDDGKGASEDCAAESCHSILSDDPAATDGLYWLDPLGDGALEVTCDMSGGGWTLVYRGTNAGGVAENGTVDDTDAVGTFPITTDSEGSNKLSDEMINALRSGDVVNDLKVSVTVDGALLGESWHLSLCKLQTGATLPGDNVCNLSTTTGPDATDWDESSLSGALTRWGADDALGYTWGGTGISLGPVSGGTATGTSPATSCSWTDEDALCDVPTAVEIWVY